MSKIDNLTKEQEASLVSYREACRKIGLATGAANISKVQPIINDFYSALGRSSPYIWRCESPLTANLVINYLGDNLGANLGANLWDNLGANLGDNLRANLWDNLRANLWDNLGANLWANLGANLRANLWDNLRANLWANLWDNLGANLGANLRANLWDNLRANLWDNLGANLWANLGANLGDNLEYVYTYLWGSLDIYWISYYEFPHKYIKSLHTEEQYNLLLHWKSLAKNCFWWYPFNGICFVCDRPTFIGQDNDHRLHNTTGPSVEFSDGWKYYAIHGVEVPSYIVEYPERVDVQKIENEDNVEIRRVMLDIFGWERYLLESGLTPIHYDDCGSLFRKQMAQDEDLVMVKVKNSSPEPDGSFKDYFLRVPPNVKTAHEAVAWTFDLSPEEYQPLKET